MRKHNLKKNFTYVKFLACMKLDNAIAVQIFGNLRHINIMYPCAGTAGSRLHTEFRDRRKDIIQNLLKPHRMCILLRQSVHGSPVITVRMGKYPCGDHNIFSVGSVAQKKLIELFHFIRIIDTAVDNNKSTVIKPYNKGHSERALRVYSPVRKLSYGNHSKPR